MLSRGKYPFPNDENEQNRDDMKHAMIMELCEGKLYYAPIRGRRQRFWTLALERGYGSLRVRSVYP